MREGRCDLLLSGRQRDPRLDPVQMVAVRPRALEPLASSRSAIRSEANGSLPVASGCPTVSLTFNDDHRRTKSDASGTKRHREANYGAKLVEVTFDRQ